MSATQLRAVREVADADWIGVYASPREISAFSGTVLALRQDRELGDDITFNMRSYSDVRSLDDDGIDKQSGTCVTDGEKLYVPRSYSFGAMLARYSLLEINGHKVLMRDDALRALREEKKLYDYGILIKVANEAPRLLDLEKVERPSIKLLYSDPNKPWKDPFLHGPNEK